MRITSSSIVEPVLYRNSIAPRTAPQNATAADYALESVSQFKFNVTPGMTVDHVAVVTIISVYLTAMMKKNESKSVETSTEPRDRQSENPNYDLGNETYIIPKRWWGGLPTQPSAINRALLHPTNLVIVAHTASPAQCMSLTDCSSYLQTIQTMHISQWGYVDIGYNFIIGGEGNVYEGLGWDVQNYLKHNSIAIAFTGNYAIYPLNDRQRNAAQKLLEIGVELGKLDEDYILVAHNQIAATLSPGKFLFQDIKYWPHYSGRLFI